MVGVVLTAGGCRRTSAEERAAAQAVEACIEALAPVADERFPSAEVLDEALAGAREAARTDDRWDDLAAAFVRAREGAGTPGAGLAIDALVTECRRSSDAVRRSGPDPQEAMGFPGRPSDGT